MRYTEKVDNCFPNKSCDTRKITNDVKPGETPIIGYRGQENATLFTYDKPREYGDSTRMDECKVCDEECPPGKFKIGGCDPVKSTNLVCKDHKTCDPETQIIIQYGTSTSDTICACIDGYEWKLDEFGQPKINEKCEKIKGECWKNPCHPNAFCYDNFDENGKYTGNFACHCDHASNWIETEDKGKGKDGCTKISDKHYHPVKEFEGTLTAPQQSDYADLLENKPDLLSVLGHTHGIANTDLNGKFHSNLNGFHIHK